MYLIYNDCLGLPSAFAQSTEAVEYTDSTSAEG